MGETGAGGYARAGLFSILPEESTLTKKRHQLLPILIILGMYILFVRNFLFRPLWFDEALTVLNFALSPNLADIYFNYSIPNNQICFTFLLRVWLEIQPVILDTTVWLRLLPVLLGAGTLVALYWLFRTRCGSWVLLPVLIALGTSVPFLIYATALRGYMLSALLAVLTLHFALLFAEHRDCKYWLCYAISSLLMVGTIPSNLVVLAGVVLYALPLFQVDFYRRWSFWIMALTPPVMLLIFYLLIGRQLIAAMQLGEGWENGSRALLAVLLAFVYCFGVILIPALIGIRYRHIRLVQLARASIWLLPVPMALLLKVAPFPRVFFPFWPLWTILLAGGIRDLTAVNCRLRHRWKLGVWIGLLAVLALIWGGLAQVTPLRLRLSSFNGGIGADDYFYGYYLRNGHTPDQTVAELKKLYPDGVAPIYLSFCADPWSVMFYGNLYGLTDPANYLFDGPRGTVSSLPGGALIILRNDESAEALEKRFGIRLFELFHNANHRVYRAE